MTSYKQSDYWSQQSQMRRRNFQWNQIQINEREDSCVLIRKSRKGTQLNLPEAFYTVYLEQPFIKEIPILPAGGCCDIEYVMYRQNALKSRPQYSPSVTINIGTSRPYNNSQYHNGVCQRNRSYSTISINPTVVSEEPWQQKREVIPLGLYCCGQPKCEHTQSVEQRVIDLNTTEITDQTEMEKGYVYVTKPPTISPLKACWKFLICKRKRNETGTYMPSVMTKTEPVKCKVCSKCSKTDNKGSRDSFRTKRNIYGIQSRLSTITESEITVSEYSSEEFVSQENKGKKEKRPFQYPQRTYTGTGKILGDSSFNSDMHSSSYYPKGEIHRWVCQPAQKKNIFNRLANKKYICYKEGTLQ